MGKGSLVTKRNKEQKAEAREKDGKTAQGKKGQNKKRRKGLSM